MNNFHLQSYFMSVVLFMRFSCWGCFSFFIVLAWYFFTKNAYYYGLLECNRIKKEAVGDKVVKMSMFCLNDRSVLLQYTKFLSLSSPDDLLDINASWFRDYFWIEADKERWKSMWSVSNICFSFFLWAFMCNTDGCHLTVLPNNNRHNMSH